MPDRISQILHFLEAIDSLKAIERATYLSNQKHHESDSDHTWHMAMFALLLYKEIAFEVDVAKVLTLILIHDLCEILAGDTFAYTPEHNDRERELEAAKQLFALLPVDLNDELLDGWKEFTFGNSPEARFARALDRMQGLAQNVFSSGRTWKERHVTQAMSRELNRNAQEFDPAIRDIFEKLFQRAVDEELWPSAI
jgi:putative hydrolase of HD superfamily